MRVLLTVGLIGDNLRSALQVNDCLVPCDGNIVIVCQQQRGDEVKCCHIRSSITCLLDEKPTTAICRNQPTRSACWGTTVASTMGEPAPGMKKADRL